LRQLWRKTSYRCLDWLDRSFSKMTCYVSSVMLNSLILYQVATVLTMYRHITASILHVVFCYCSQVGQKMRKNGRHSRILFSHLKRWPLNHAITSVFWYVPMTNLFSCTGCVLLIRVLIDRVEGTQAGVR